MIKTAVKAELKKRGLSVYAAAGLFEGILSRPHLYHWLSGRHNITDEKADAILSRLGLGITPVSTPPDPPDHPQS